MTSWCEADPFDLPDWLGLGPVIWRATSSLGRASVRGELTGGGDPIDCDLLAVDEACPSPVAEGTLRTAAHQAWRRGEVQLVEYDARLTLAVPGVVLDADGVLDALGRFARAVGADPASYSVSLRVRA